MDDVENVARFLAPKYLASYRDRLYWLHLDIGREISTSSMCQTDIEMLLQLGVSTRTEVSLLELGLSRTSAVELFAFIASDEMSPQECAIWLAEQDLSRLGVPELVRREVARVLTARSN